MSRYLVIVNLSCKEEVQLLLSTSLRMSPFLMTSLLENSAVASSLKVESVDFLFTLQQVYRLMKYH